MKKRWIAIVGAAALMLTSSIALAAPSPDTLLVSGYDSETMAVLYGVIDLDENGETECTDEDFQASADELLAADDESTASDVEPAGDGEADCSLESVDVSRDGEVNHGSVVSTFAKLLQGGNGCLIRLFAQSDYGKSDADEVDGGDLEFVLEQAETSCSKKKVDDDASTSTADDDASSVGDDEPSEDDASNGGGREDAPGQNKDKSNRGKAKGHQGDDD